MKDSLFSLQIPNICFQGQPNQKADQVVIPELGALHSSADPEREAQRQWLNLQSRKYQSILYIGMGYGYIVDAAFKARTKKNEQNTALQHTRYCEPTVFFYEPIQEMRKKLKENGRYQQWKKLMNSEVATTDTKITDIIEDLPSWLKSQKRPSVSPIQIIFSPVYYRYFPQWCDQLNSYLSQSTRQKKTKEKFARQWFHHYLINLGKENLSFLTMNKREQIKITGQPILFCGASSSLLPELEMLREKNPNFLTESLVIASDSAVIPLSQAKIPIDLIISVDSGRGTLMHFANLAHFLPTKQKKNKSQIKSQIPLLTWLGGAPQLDQWFSEVIYYRSTYPLDQLLAEEQLAQLPLMENPSNTMVGLAILLAELKKSQNLYIAGVSFVSRQGQSHVVGNGYTYYAQCLYHRTNSMLNQLTTNSHYPQQLLAADKRNWQACIHMARKRKIKLKRLKQLLRQNKSGEMMQILAKTNPQSKSDKPVSMFTKETFPAQQLYSTLKQSLKKYSSAQFTETLALNFDYTKILQKAKLARNRTVQNSVINHKKKENENRKKELGFNNDYS